MEHLCSHNFCRGAPEDFTRAKTSAFTQLQQGKSDMITNEVVNRAIEFILHHAGEELSVEDVAGHCHFSKFYFSRLFKAETGESVYSFIRRVRIEQSAFRLKVEHGRRITDIGLDYGYSPSNYSSAALPHHAGGFSPEDLPAFRDAPVFSPGRESSGKLCTVQWKNYRKGAS